MSLSSFLLPSKAGNTLDKELDSLFFKKKQQQNDSVAGPSSRTTATLVKATKDNGKKRKGGAGDAREEEEPSKRRKDESWRAEEKTMKEGKAGKNDKKGKARRSDDEEDEAGLEDAYLMAHEPQPVEEETEAEAEEEGADDDDDDRDDVLVHESLKKKNKKTSSRPKTKYVPPSETPEQRNQRTIFIGNLSTSVAQKRPLQKQLHRHILQYIPTAKIESTRFRSVPFATPTSNLAVDTEKSPSTTTSTASKSTTTTRQHDISRTSAWRTNHHHPSSAAAAFTTSESDPKSFLTPSQKKKIAFINHEFHASADAVNAYIVFAHPLPVPVSKAGAGGEGEAGGGARWPPNLPPPREVMDPYEAARGAAGRCDGTVFMERLLRVDLVGGGGGGGKARVGEEAELLAGAGAGADPKLSIFVGNLDFASREDEVRVFFEGVVGKERGERLAVEGSVDGDGKKRGCVTRVRIVRDKETQMGKGFAYVQFADRECVDEILAMEEGTLKFAKRKLRVQRCKTVPGASTSTRQITAQAGHGKQPARRGSDEPSGAGPANKSRGRAGVPTPTPVPIVPKGDPALGAKLAGLSKDARKQAKAVDADRVARRLAKKKARMVMQTTGAAGVKLGRMDGGGGGGGAKERQRVRKSGKGGAVNAGTGKKKVRKAKSGRVRSEKAIAKMNGKKTQAA